MMFNRKHNKLFLTKTSDSYLQMSHIEAEFPEFTCVCKTQKYNLNMIFKKLCEIQVSKFTWQTAGVIKSTADPKCGIGSID